MTPVEFKELAKLPFIDIPYTTAEKYKGQIAALMERLANSNSGEAKNMKPKDFRWRLVYRRAEDPERVTDTKAFSAALSAESECWLKASGKGWIGYEPISVTPPQIRAQYEQRARLICGQRLQEQEKEPEEDDLFEEFRNNGHKEVDLLGAFDEWIRQNQSCDKRIASIARLALLKLME